MCWSGLDQSSGDHSERFHGSVLNNQNHKDLPWFGVVDSTVRNIKFRPWNPLSISLSYVINEMDTIHKILLLYSQLPLQWVYDSMIHLRVTLFVIWETRFVWLETKWELKVAIFLFALYLPLDIKIMSSWETGLSSALCSMKSNSSALMMSVEMTSLRVRQTKCTAFFISNDDFTAGTTCLYPLVVSIVDLPVSDKVWLLLLPTLWIAADGHSHC